MKKLLVILIVLAIALTSCTKADQLAMEKNQEAADVGIPRTFTVKSAYTNTIAYQRFFKNSYFEGGTDESSIDIDILDLKTGDKVSLLSTTGFILIIEEGEVSGVKPDANPADK